MDAIPLIAQLYMLSAGIGGVFVTFSAAMGASHGHGAHGAGHGGGAHGGHAGAGHAIGHSGHAGGTAGHTGSAGGMRGGAATGGHAGTGGHGAAGSHGATGSHGTTGGHGIKGPTGASSHSAATGGHGIKGPTTGGHTAAGHGTAHQTGAHGTSQHAPGSTNAADSAAAPLNGTAAAVASSGAAAQQQITVPTERGSNDRLTMLFLTICNPMLISLFLTFTGSTGMILWRLAPLPIEWTVAPAIVSGLICSKIAVTFLGWLTSKMFSSKTFTMSSLIGCEAEVTVSIPPGRMGEIMYTVGARRYTASAKSEDPTMGFKAAQQVVIVDMIDGTAIVSKTWNEIDAFDQSLAESEIQKAETNTILIEDQAMAPKQEPTT